MKISSIHKDERGSDIFENTIAIIICLVFGLLIFNLFLIDNETRVKELKKELKICEMEYAIDISNNTEYCYNYDIQDKRIKLYDKENNMISEILFNKEDNIKIIKNPKNNIEDITELKNKITKINSKIKSKKK